LFVFCYKEMILLIYIYIIDTQFFLLYGKKNKNMISIAIAILKQRFIYICICKELCKSKKVKKEKVERTENITNNYSYMYVNIF